MPLTRLATLSGAPDSLQFLRMGGREALGRPFQYDVEMLSDDSTIDLSLILGQPLTVKLELPDGALRYFSGIVTQFRLVGGLGNFVRYAATLQPWLTLLERTADSRIFQRKTAVEVVKEIFDGLGFSDYEDRLSDSYRTWEYLVQYRETDFNFVSRILEREGIYYYFVHDDGKHTLVLADGPGAHDTFPGYDTVPFFPVGTAVRDDHLDSWVVGRRIVSGAFAASDYNFETPKANLLATQSNPLGYAQDSFELYEYPGEYINRSDGSQQVRVRLEEEQAEWEVAEGGGNARGLPCGSLFTLEGQPRDDQNREYLIIATSTELQVNPYESGEGISSRYHASVSAIDSKTPFRAPSTARKTRVEGPQTAVVVGPSGEEIWTDKYGRVKVQFPWDRYGKGDENSSCWVRVSQVWAGSNWGAMHIPRIGQEVIVDFLEGDPDRPIITGRVYNASNMPPYSLPGNQTKSGIKSRSSKGGSASNFNEIRFEDLKGQEELYVQAEKDLNSLVKNDETAQVGVDRTRTIGNNDTLSVGKDRNVHVGANETIQIDADESLTVGGNETITVTGNESVTIGGNESTTIAGSQSLIVAAVRSETVGGAESITVGGVRSITVGGAQSLSVGGALSEAVGGDVTISVSGKRSASVGSDETVSISGGQTVSVGKTGALSVKQQLVIDAGDEVVIKAGDASITLKKNGDIVLKGKNLTSDASGKVSVKAASDLVLKGSKISQN